MFIDKFNNGGKPSLRLVQSEYTRTASGKKMSVKKVVRHLGPLDRFCGDEDPDEFLKRLRKSFKEGVALIPELEPYCSAPGSSSDPEIITLQFTTGSDDCVADPKIFSDCLFAAAFRELGLSHLFSMIKVHGDFEFDFLGFMRLLVYGRILNPASKIATVSQNDHYYLPPLGDETDFDPFAVYKVLDVIYDNHTRIYKTIDKNLSSLYARDTSVLFYDVTNFFFEIDEPDPDEEDEDGNVIQKGLRKNGVSKESRKQPIVQVGLFMDRDGIPIGVKEFPGNTLDHLTVQESALELTESMGYGRFVFVGDRGMTNHQNCAYLLSKGNGYLVSKSIKKSTKTDRQWILDPEGYKYPYGGDATSCTFKYKSKVVTRTTTLKSTGKKYRYKELVVVYWSKSFYKREFDQNKSFIEFLEKLESNPSRFRITTKEKNFIRKFLSKEVVNTETGEIFDAARLKVLVDWDKVKEWRSYMGYYQIVTSETEMDPLEVIDNYHELSQIEDRFRIMKSWLDIRPCYVRTPEHISAHLCICAIALIIFCLIQKVIQWSGLVEKKEEQNWFSGLPGDRLVDALNKFTVDRLPGGYYRLGGLNDEDLQLILKSIGIQPEKKLYSRGELRTLRDSVKLLERLSKTCPRTQEDIEKKRHAAPTVEEVKRRKKKTEG